MQRLVDETKADAALGTRNKSRQCVWFRIVRLFSTYCELVSLYKLAVTTNNFVLLKDRLANAPTYEIL